MGCDIHLWVESCVGATWRFANDLSTKEYDGETWTEWRAPYDHRNYYLFAMLAGVRGAGLPFVPISRPRGIPVDISSVGQRICDEWGADGHSHSWLSAVELLGYEWSAQVDFEGYIRRRDLRLLEEQGVAPNEWMSDRTGDQNCFARWSRSSALCAGSFYSTFLPTLGEYGPAAQVRIVFFFDN